MKNNICSKMLICINIILLACFVKGEPVIHSNIASPFYPQCGQYSIHYCCQLLGVPVSMEQVCKLIPPKEVGESMLEVHDALELIGLDCMGEKVSFEELKAGSFPIIAHMNIEGKEGQSELHFVVIEGSNPSGVKILDSGDRKMLTTEAFLKQWNGYILRVTKPNGIPRIPSFMPKAGKGRPRLQFDTLFIDAGDIPQGKQEYLFTYPFRNTGDSDLIINQIKTQCKCTVADIPSEAIRPGETGKISIKYSLQGPRGKFYQPALVTSNDPYFPLIKLGMAGNGIQNVKIMPSQLNFGNVVTGNNAVACCFITHAGDSLLNLKSAKTNAKELTVKWQALTPDLMKKYYPQTEGVTINECINKYFVEATLDTKEMTPGKADFSVEINTNLEDFSKITIPVTARILPPIQAIPGKLFLGEIKKGGILNESIIVKSNNGRKFSISKVDTGNPQLQCTYSSDINEIITLYFVGLIENLDQVIIITAKTDGSDSQFTIVLPIQGIIRT